MRAYRGIPCYYIGSTVHECHVIYSYVTRCSDCRSLSLSAFSLCQLLLLLRGNSVGGSLYSCTWPKCLTEGFYVIILIIIIFTPRSRVLWQKLTCFQPVQNFSNFYVIPKFITAFAKCQPPVPILGQIEPVLIPHRISWRSNLVVFPPSPASPKCSLSLRSPHHNAVYPSPLPHTLTCLAYIIFLELTTPKNIGWRVQIYCFYFVSISIIFALSYSIITHPVEMQRNLKVSLKVFLYSYCVKQRLLEWWPSLCLQVCHRQLQHTATAVLQGTATLWT